MSGARGFTSTEDQPGSRAAFELVMRPSSSEGSEEVWEHVIVLGASSGAVLAPTSAHQARGAAHSLGAPEAVFTWLDALDEALDAEDGGDLAARVLPSYLAFAARVETTRRLSPAAADLAHHGSGPDSAIVIGWPTHAAVAALAAPTGSATDGALAHSLLAALPESDPLWTTLRGATDLDAGATPLRLRLSWQHTGGAAVDVRLETAPAHSAPTGPEPAVAAAALAAAGVPVSGEAGDAETWAIGRARAWGNALRRVTSSPLDVQVLRAAGQGHGARALAGDLLSAPAELSAAEAAALPNDELRLWFPSVAASPPVAPADGPAAVRRLANPETDPYWREICGQSVTAFTSSKPAGCTSWYSDTTTFWCGIGSNCNFCNSGSTAAGYYYYAVFLSYCECAAGQYSAAGASSCTTCPTGHYSATSVSSSCTICPAGKFADSGASSCSVCAAGTESSSGSGACTDCAAGKYSLGGSSAVPSCTNCQAGKYQTFEGVSFCISCPSGYYCPLGSADYTANPCSAGKYSATGASACTSCPGGYYSASSGANNCAACGSGSRSALASGSTGCVSCSAGTYQHAGGQTVCLSCTGGQYSASSGQVACTDCAAGKYVKSLMPLQILGTRKR